MIHEADLHKTHLFFYELYKIYLSYKCAIARLFQDALEYLNTYFLCFDRGLDGVAKDVASFSVPTTLVLVSIGCLKIIYKPL